MNIAVPSDDQQTVAHHTGRCAGFLVFRVEDGRASRQEYRQNSFTDHARGQCGDHDHQHDHRHGHGHHGHAPLIEALRDCQAIVAGGMGPRLVVELEQNGIEVYAASAHDAQESADLYAQGKLPRMSPQSSCGRH